jgi:hypothetical protein
MNPSPTIRARLRASAIHACISLALVSVVAAPVFGLWYPSPFRELTGGGRLFAIVAVVDLVLGPLLTLIIFDTRKSRQELTRDLSIIGLLQCSALAFGGYTTAMARPVYAVFEVDLIRVVTANQVIKDRLPQAAPELRALSWSGPQLIGVAKPVEANQQFETMMLGAQGTHLAWLPNYWVSYEQVRTQALLKAAPLAALKLRNTEQTRLLAAALKSAGLAANKARWLPLVSSRASWIALLNEQGDWVASAEVDSF